MGHITRTNCRLCEGPLEMVLDLGPMALNDFVEEGKQPEFVPLTLVTCQKCGLVQLQHTADMDTLYREYWYQSGLNKSMVDDLKDIVEDIERRVSLHPRDMVVDIGCNDGTMLSQYDVPDLHKIGFDPALNLKEKADKVCDIFVNDYFHEGSSQVIKDQAAKVVTTIAMFYDLEDPHSFVADVARILADKGIWVIQFTDLLSMLTLNAFDNICHEHLEYYSFTVLRNLLAQHGLDVFHVSTNLVNGGSIRAFVGWQGMNPVDRSVEDLLLAEDQYMREKPFKRFVTNVAHSKRTIMEFLDTAKKRSEEVYIMGASTKGNTLLQFYGIDHTLIPYAAEVNPDKFGKRTVATNIPIISEKEALERNPDFFLVLPWHFINMLTEVHTPYLEKGGSLVVPLPEPCEYTIDGRYPLYV